MHHSLASTLEHLSSFQLFVIILGHWFLSLWLYQAEFLKTDLLGERVWFFFFQSLDIDCQSPFRNLVPIYTSTSCLCEHRLYWTQSSSDVTSRCQNSFSSFGSEINIQDNESFDNQYLPLLHKMLLQNECLYPSEACMLKPNFQCEGIWTLESD